MKKLVFVFVIITIFSWNMVIAQWKVIPTIGFSHGISVFGSYHTEKIASISKYHYNTWFHLTDLPYQITNISGGISLLKDKNCLVLNVDYGYFFCSILNNKFNHDNISDRPSIKSHFIGFHLENRFRENKIIRPLISVGFLTEIATNYNHRYLDAEDYYPKIYHYSSAYLNEKVNLYKSTPFIGNLLLGCDFRIYQGLSANIKWGYSMRILKAQYGTLYFSSENQNEFVANQSENNPYTLVFNYMTVQLGLSYCFINNKKI